MSNEMKDYLREIKEERAKTLSDLDLRSRFELSSLILAQKVMLPHGYTEYAFVDDFRHTLRVGMDTDKHEIAAILVNDKPADLHDLQVLSDYVDYATDFPEDHVNADLLGLITTGQEPQNSVFTVDRVDPECETWFYSYHSRNNPKFDSGSFFNATENDVRIGCRGVNGAVFEETIPARTWIDVSDPLEIAAFERAYAGNGPIAEVPEQEKAFDFTR